MRRTSNAMSSAHQLSSSPDENKLKKSKNMYRNMNTINLACKRMNKKDQIQLAIMEREQIQKSKNQSIMLNQVKQPDFEVKNPKRFMFYPSSTFKVMFWDVLASVFLLITCILTPINLAYSDELEQVIWYLNFNYAIDIFFGLDILMNFNSATVDDNFNITDDRRQIALDYVRSWFLIDLLSILPFELMAEKDVTDEASQAKINQIVRITRISKLYKLAKVVKLLRLFKWVKRKREITQKVMAVVRTGAAIDRVVFFVMMLLLMCHFVGCIWIFIGKSFDLQDEIVRESWIIGSQMELLEGADLYAAATYFTM